jgi:hypothetical protein
MDTNFALTQIQQDIAMLRNDVAKALTHLEVIDAKSTVTNEIQKDHEERLRLLERFRWTILGFAILGNTLAGFTGYWIAHLLHS